MAVEYGADGIAAPGIDSQALGPQKSLRPVPNWLALRGQIQRNRRYNRMVAMGGLEPPTPAL
jgi:hypothetical protein